MNNKVLVTILIVGAVGVGLGFLVGSQNWKLVTLDKGNDTGIACTQEAKQCPDGSYVGRTGPKCEFAACPENPETKDWKLSRDLSQNIEFKYPEVIAAKYITGNQWPPKVTLEVPTFSCPESPVTDDAQGKTERMTIRMHAYCVSTRIGAAAGSMYIDYKYTTAREGKFVTLSFTLQYPECANYDEQERKTCEDERTTFDLDTLVDRMMQTLRFTSPGAPSVMQGITGAVLLGPICPVERIPPLPECADKPFQTNLVVTTADQARVIKEFSSDSNGTFKVDIPPGEYAIRSAAAANILPYCASATAIRVEQGSYTQVTVNCDSGIR